MICGNPLAQTTKYNCSVCINGSSAIKQCPRSGFTNSLKCLSILIHSHYYFAVMAIFLRNRTRGNEKAFYLAIYSFFYSLVEVHCNNAD